MQMRSTFLVLGVQKAGTTSLYHYLNQHPDIYMTQEKEPTFFEFDEQYSKGNEYYWNNYFSEWAGEKAIGDANPNNIFLPYVPVRIGATLPDAKLLIILRNPTDRAYSQWWMRTSFFGIEKESFENCVRNELEHDDLLKDYKKIFAKYSESNRRLSLHPFYVSRGYYHEQITRYIKKFGREQIMVLFFEDLIRQKTNLFDKIFEFIGVDPSNYSNMKEHHFNAFDSRTAFFVDGIVKSKFHKLFSSRLRGWILNSLLKFKLGGKRPPMNPSIRSFLTAHYSPYNRALEKILDLDLSHWDS